MAKKTTGPVYVVPVKKKTTIGNSTRTRPKKKDQRRNFKKYRGQGK